MSKKVSEETTKTEVNINWSKTSWNPCTGCKEISSGCLNCYAKSMAERFRGGKAFPDGFDFKLHPERLTMPYKWKKPRVIFVNSMSDLFYSEVPDDYIVEIFKVMEDTPQHSYRILTKRAERMVEWFTGVYQKPCPKNVWMGVTVESGEYAHRIDLLKQIDAEVKFVCFEPLVGSVPVTKEMLSGLQWIIAGGETGRKARQMKKAWIDPIYKVASELNIPFFFKHWGNYDEHGKWTGKGGKDNLYNGKVIQDYPVELSCNNMNR